MIRSRSLTTPGLLAAAFAGACVAAACDGRQPTATESNEAAPSSSAAPARAGSAGAGVVAELDFTRGVPEEVSTPIFGSTPRRSHLDLARVLRSLDATPPKGLFVRLGSATIGLAGSQEIGARLGALRKRGIPVVCHADGYENSTLLLAASGCSRIWVSPAGGVDSVGLAAQLLYGRSLLDRLHVVFQEQAIRIAMVAACVGPWPPSATTAPSTNTRR